ncbi:hypothetical protein B0J11DRAFT_69277 [Dendryphion nanum]|uniref:Uncharacterized protein n=1 Tax=Dendryphion nanum TaxID=256645 RepID=A0A9P9IH14_9PLEO|nr:hypothetical protein B0J11DRAFT_69277 [Dendryphion nanum]
MFELWCMQHAVISSLIISLKFFSMRTQFLRFFSLLTEALFWYTLHRLSSNGSRKHSSLLKTVTMDHTQQHLDLNPQNNFTSFHYYVVSLSLAAFPHHSATSISNQADMSLRILLSIARYGCCQTITNLIEESKSKRIEKSKPKPKSNYAFVRHREKKESHNWAWSTDGMTGSNRKRKRRRRKKRQEDKWDGETHVCKEMQKEGVEKQDGANDSQQGATVWRKLVQKEEAVELSEELNLSKEAHVGRKLDQLGERQKTGMKAKIRKITEETLPEPRRGEYSRKKTTDMSDRRNCDSRNLGSSRRDSYRREQEESDIDTIPSREPSRRRQAEHARTVAPIPSSFSRRTRRIEHVQSSHRTPSSFQASRSRHSRFHSPSLMPRPQEPPRTCNSLPLSPPEKGLSQPDSIRISPFKQPRLSLQESVDFVFGPGFSEQTEVRPV